MTEIPTLESVADELVSRGAVYVAVGQKPLSKDYVQMYYYIPPGHSKESEAIWSYLTDTVGIDTYESQPGTVAIGDQELPILVTDVLQDGLHTYHRVPVYAENIPGLDPISVEDGVAAVQDFVAGNPQPSPASATTVPLEDLVSDLADAGAASVELSTSHLRRDSPLVHLRIPIVPADGQPIVGPVDAVEIAGETYPLRSTLTMDGPARAGRISIPLYVSDGVEGLEPRSVADGVEVGRKVLQKAVDADAHADLATLDPRVPPRSPESHQSDTSQAT